MLTISFGNCVIAQQIEYLSIRTIEQFFSTMMNNTDTNT